jgi:hypothetical protein
MNVEYQLLDQTGTTIAMGSQSQMFSFLKHHVPDGRYRIVGPDMKLHCLRTNGVVEPDPDGVCLKSRRATINDLLNMTVADPPYADETQGDHDGD